MPQRPCIDCGELIPTGTRCTDCKPADTKKPRQIAHAGTDSRWRALSLRVRRLQPWCIDCHTDQDLTADHILPVDEFPELAYEIENLTVRCRPHNSSRGNRYTQAEAQEVLNRLVSERDRIRKVKYRRLIPVAQRAAQEGNGPPDQAVHPGGKAQGALLSGFQGPNPGPLALREVLNSVVGVCQAQDAAVENVELRHLAEFNGSFSAELDGKSILGARHTESLP